MDGQDVFLCILAFFIPPLGLAMKIGVHNKAFCLNVLLTIIALPFGMAHAMFTINKAGKAAKLAAQGTTDPVHPLASQTYNNSPAARTNAAGAPPTSAYGIRSSRSFSSSKKSLVYDEGAIESRAPSTANTSIAHAPATNAYSMKPIRSPASITNEKAAPPDYDAK